MNYIKEYQKAIENGEVVSERVRKVYANLCKDMNKNANSRWIFDEDLAEHAICFIENFCKHSKGKKGGQPFILELWQKALISAVFGFVDRETNLRRFKEILLVIGRKNGKSTLAAAVGLYLMLADGEQGAEIYSAATKFSQAKIIWEEAKRMIKKNKSLSKKVKVRVDDMICEGNNAVFAPLSSESNTLDGLNVHGGLIDELHAISDKNLYDVIADGTSAREQPLIFITSTAGSLREGIFDIKYDDACKQIDGQADFLDERKLAIIYELDKKDEWTDPNCWKKANPGLGTIKQISAISEKVQDAQNDYRKVKNLLCKDFNIRENVGDSWLNYEEIVNEKTFDLAKLKPKYGIGGVDLSQTTDLTAAKVLFMIPNDEKIYVLSMYWLPEDLLEQRSREDRIPYDEWYKMGLLRTCDGNKIHPKYITDWFIELQDLHGIYMSSIGYDAWSAAYWDEEMERIFGKSVMTAVHQGKRTLSSPMHNLKADLIAKKVIYNNNPIDKWCLSNTYVETDKNGNIQPTKGKSQRMRIDGTAALLNAYVMLEENYGSYVNMI